MHWKVCMCLIISVMAIVYSGFAQDGAVVFKTHCAVCHTIGGGRTVGPDLAGITASKKEQWLISFIRNSQEVIKSGDPDAVAIAKEYNNLLMPPFAGSDAEIKAIIRHMASKGGQAAVAVADTMLNKATDGHVERGRALFTGEVALQHGGASCLSCHGVHDNGGMGGSMAKGLNLTYFTLKGTGLRAMLQAPPFPAMASAYAEKPLTDQEIYDLAAYMKHVSTAMVKGETNKTLVPFLPLGIAGWIAGMILLFGIWRMRKRASVNKEIFARQIASEK